MYIWINVQFLEDKLIEIVFGKTTELMKYLAIKK